MLKLNRVKKSHRKTWGNSWQLKKKTSETILFEKYTFDNVSTFFLPKVHIKIFAGINLLMNFKPQTIISTNSVFITLLEAIFVLLEFCQ